MLERNFEVLISKTHAVGDSQARPEACTSAGSSSAIFTKAAFAKNVKYPPEGSLSTR